MVDMDAQAAHLHICLGEDHCRRPRTPQAALLHPQKSSAAVLTHAHRVQLHVKAMRTGQQVLDDLIQLLG